MTRAAANSIARGMPSSRQQIWATEGYVLHRQYEIRLGKLGALFKQAHGFIIPEFFERLLNIGESKRGKTVLDLSQNAQRLAAGGEDFQIGGNFQERIG